MSEEEHRCLAGYAALEKAAQRFETRDARHQRVEHLPYLRTSRFLASFDTRALSEAAYRQWLFHHHALAVEGLTIEWKRLPIAGKQPLDRYWPSKERAFKRKLKQCGALLLAHQAERPRLTHIAAQDHYQTWKRWVGLYPLAAIPFYHGVVSEQTMIRRRQNVFNDKLNTADITSASGLAAESDSPSWTRFTGPIPALSPVEALGQLRQQPLDALGVPQLSEAAREQLVDAFMPTLAIENTDNTLADNDRPVQLTASRGAVARNPDQPTLYTHISLGRYRDQVTLQLNYSVWFSERRPEGLLDWLAGQYNGITWRVHLLPSGAVVGYDKMHQCGCWYQFFPAMGFRPRPQLPLAQEPFNIGRTLDPRERHTLWLEANTHHLLGVSAAPGSETGTAMEVHPYSDLRALETPEGPSQSPFDSRGLIPASRRPERWIFWPMGIASPGALRIHGTHAIAFIGRRHFDDPRLLRELGLE
ncbi:hypothetical protein [Marinimicrobium sp. C2-29]|uniref:hypothetical protein n=1 Tax=Marinimicrobium sp. C2-29 TaxID=3139825 RepID=UPI003139004C